VINQGLVRFLDPREGATNDDHDRFTDGVVRQIVDDGEAFFQATTFLGHRCMRISVSSWMTDRSEVDRTITSVRRAIEHISHDG
jgi:hypothetical protein